MSFFTLFVYKAWVGGQKVQTFVHLIIECPLRVREHAQSYFPFHEPNILRFVESSNHYFNIHVCL